MDSRYSCLKRWRNALIGTLFMTVPSLAQTVQIGSGTATQSNLPIVSCYGYTYSQQIYTSAQIGQSGDIEKIRFYFNGSSDTGGSTVNSTGWSVYMGHTALTTFATSTSWVPVASLTQVFSGAVSYPAAGNWMEITLATPFPYNGTENLLIAVDENTPNWNCTITWRSFTSGSNTGIYFRSDGTNPNPATPPTATSRTSSLAQVQLDFVQPPCIGTPDPGNTISSASPICSGVNFTLSLQNATPGSGVTYQWQTSPEGTSWANAPGASTSATYSASQTAATYYKAIVSCSGVPGESNPVLVGMDVPTNCYCTPTYTTGKTSGDLIANIAILGTTLANNSGTAAVNPAYTFFTGQPNYTATLNAGTTYTVSISIGSWGNQGLAAWIDYNDNGIFEASERIGFTAGTIGSGTGGAPPYPADHTTTFNITLACNPPVGTHRLRVRQVYAQSGSLIDPCNTQSYGETEDYLVTVAPPPPCPAPSNVLSSNLTDTSIDLDWTIGCVETAWEIEYGPSGFTPGTGTVVPVVAKPYSLSGLAQSTQYQAYLRADCGGDGVSANSAPISFTTFGPPACIASPTSPENGSGACVGSNVTLSWPSAPTATGYDVYLDGTQIAFAQAGTSISAGTLAAGPHTWSVVPLNTYGPASNCSEWSFNLVDAPTITASNDGPACQGEDIVLSVSGTYDPLTSFSWTGPALTNVPGSNVTIEDAAPSANGTYTVTANNQGCTATANTTVLVNANPVIVSTTATPALVCSGEDAQLQVNMFAPSAYCTATHTTGCGGGDEYIANVTFSSINQSSTCAQTGTGQYTNYTSVTTAVTAGTSVPITVSNPNFFTGDQSRVYVDWNQNGLFTDAGEETILTGTTSFTGNIVVPSNAINGDTRMRVRLTYSSGMAPCGTASYGETEDYTVIVSGGNEAYSYSWSPSNYLSSVSIAAPQALGVTTDESYTVTVMNAAGCTSEGSTSLTVNITDTDIDGTIDCEDACPNDPLKIAPGQCGCGVPDTDTDLDGTADCNDDCPNDPNKIAPGQCGCGNPDTDTDGDGTADCNDLCPTDANKIAPGLCGCGLPDADVNNNGICDLLETLPTVQLGVVPAPNDQIELQLLPSDFYSGLFSSSVVTVRWITTPGMTLNSASAAYVDPAMQTAAGNLIHVGTTTNGIYSYSTFATYGNATLQSAGLYWAQNTIVPFFRVPYTNTSGSCIEFEVLDDPFQSSTNRLWYASLNGVESNNGYISGSTSAEAAPAPDCQNISVTLVDGAATIVPTDITSSFNGCSEVFLSLDQTSFDCTNVGENIVTLTIDASGHISTCSATVTVISTLEASATTTPILCNGDLSDVVVTATGGSAPYTGTGTFPTPAGAYSYTITDDDGCTSTVSGVLTQPDAIDADATSATIPCPGGVTEVLVTATGGTGVLTGTGSFTLPAGIHMFTIEDENGCTEEVQHEVLFVLEDADGDGVCDDQDLCPGSPEPGMSCDDLNAGTINDTVDANCLCAGTPIVVLQLNALLDGPYDALSGLMNDNLRSAGLVPNAHPYASAPFNHNGTESIDPSILLVSGDDAIVDWVLLELRDAMTPSTIIAGRAALVQRDGDIVDLDGTSAVTFLNIVPGSYHVAVRHRNHFGVMTASSLSLDHNATTLDITSAATLVHGLDARKDVAGTMLLWGTNALPDGQLKYTGTQNDRDPILVKIGGLIPTATVSGYHPEDVNLNGIVSYAGANNDRDPILVNLDGDVIGVRLQQLP